MNDEIKEILDGFDKCLKNYELDKAFGQLSVESIYHLFPHKQLLLKDYITNLQQENERLKERVAYLERSNNRREDTIIGLRFEVAEQEDYKYRCEKAVEYIKNCEIVDKDKRYPLLEEQFGEDLLNILQNGSDSQ